MTVFVLDKRKQPLMPCSNKRARLLLQRGRAVVHRMQPFTIRLKDRKAEDSDLQPVVVKIDPGSRITGIATVRQDSEDTVLLHGIELHHRGFEISRQLLQRSSRRRDRRSRKTRYRPNRHDNRKKPTGWLPPSLKHRVKTTNTWVVRLRCLAPVTGLAYESMQFDTQKLRNPEISGVEYQQGTLLGYTIRAYVLEKWNYRCAYCGVKDRLTLDHVVPRSRGGSDSVTNLVAACNSCNQRKGNRSLTEFLARRPELLIKIRGQLKKPLRDAAAMNATRLALHRELLQQQLPIRTGTGTETAFIRKRLKLHKSHVVDAEGFTHDPI